MKAKHEFVKSFVKKISQALAQCLRTRARKVFFSLALLKSIVLNSSRNSRDMQAPDAAIYNVSFIIIYKESYIAFDSVYSCVCVYGYIYYSYIYTHENFVLESSAAIWAIE